MASLLNSKALYPPFPAEIDRNDFGNWLSGFTDGEACFYLGVCYNKKLLGHKPIPMAFFAIGLRFDDLPILKLIRSYFGCGVVSQKVQNKIGHPAFYYKAASIEDLTNVIIPHFVKYPLRAKKASDFLIWKEGVELMKKIKYTKRDRRPGNAGFFHKWSKTDLQSYLSIMNHLRSSRHPDSSSLTLPSTPKELFPLYDECDQQ